MWELTVLCLLRERPMHPYEMQRLIRQRHKEEFLELKRGSLYHAIERLARGGFIEEDSVGREGRRPERTTYRLTTQGDVELRDWLQNLLAKPNRVPSPFVAALSFIGHLSPEEAADQLQIRVNSLECGIVALTAVLQNMTPRIGRLPLVEAEYILALQRAELDWVKSFLTELRGGQLTWNTEELLSLHRRCPLDEEAAPS
jgi:DNA-binding PadR family transcriptional regulator